MYGRELYYEPVDETPKYVLRGGTLVDLAGSPVILQTVKPGITIRNGTRSGAYSTYLEETEWDEDSRQLSMRFSGESSVLVLSEQIQMGV